MSNYLCGLEEGAQVTVSGTVWEFYFAATAARFGSLLLRERGLLRFRSMLHWLLADVERAIKGIGLAVVGGRDGAGPLLPRGV